MSVTSIMIAGVGGQGLVLATKVLAQLALTEGMDVKTGDVVGLAQRGGMVWGSVRFGEKVHSPLVPLGKGDFMLALEELEALRWTHLLKQGARVFLTKQRIYPNLVLTEKKQYPQDVESLLMERGFSVVSVDAVSIARELGNDKLLNTIMLGSLSAELPFCTDTWEKVIEDNVPAKTVELNIQAFYKGRELGL